MPDVIEQTFAAVGESMADWLTLHRLDPAYRAHFADGSTIDVLADADAMADQIAADLRSGRTRPGFGRFVGWLTALYELQFDRFIDRNLDSLTDLDARRDRPAGRARRLPPARAARSRRSCPTSGCSGCSRSRRCTPASSPDRALALYAVITYLDSVQGVYFPTGGMHALPRALADAAAKHGVQFRYGARADRHRARRRAGRRGPHRRRRATAGRRRRRQRRPADGLPATARPRGHPRRRDRAYSPSCVLVHLGTAGAARRPAHHEISFGAAWSQTFTEIIADGQLMSDPSFLVSTPTFTDPALAPAGPPRCGRCCSRRRTSPAPVRSTGPRSGRATSTTSWPTLADRGFDPATGAEVLRCADPGRLARGRAGRRHPVRRRPHVHARPGRCGRSTLDRRIENLLRCGSNVQPGVGIPMALISGRLAAQRLPLTRFCDRWRAMAGTETASPTGAGSGRRLAAAARRRRAGRQRR